MAEFDKVVSFLDSCLDVNDLLFSTIEIHVGKLKSSIQNVWRSIVQSRMPSVGSLLKPLSLHEKMKLVSEMAKIAASRVSETFTAFWSYIFEQSLDQLKSIKESIKRECAMVLVKILSNHYVVAFGEYVQSKLERLSKNETFVDMAENPEKYI
eukprot:GDKJ01008203.1.p1 GENE.GDKJ01008203.1~~GDKJ01008203.1.p1  ORF type:complete len:153 (-),score=27.98 GDKJ01008203.1:55-513(-)